MALGPLSPDENYQGVLLVVSLVQEEAFPEQIRGFRSSKFVVRNPALKSLSLFLDDDGIIRVGGRLQFSSLSYSAKHPALLPINHFFSLMLVGYFHIKHLHIGPQALLATTRQQFWILNGRQLAKKVCRDCFICNRVRPRLLKQKMAPLPAERVQQAPPFYNVAVDYAGPFYVHHRIRGRVATKTYLVVFVCFVTKAVHLELAADLTTKAFIGAFRRFVATRGLCKRVYSDNATNFVGANTELHDLYILLQSSSLKDEIKKLTQDDNILWHFIPAGSPHFGGLHEAAVKSAKYHLRRVVGKANLTYDELLTIIKQVEATLNSRPLTTTSTTNDVEVLTPGHFLIGRALTALPEPNLPDDRNENYYQRWDLVSYLYKQIWSRWHRDYLHTLQQMYYWQDKERNLDVGTIVAIHEDHLPPLKWRLGRVISLHPGRDNLVRVATVKTSTGTIQRAITKLAPLPVDVEPRRVQGGEK